MNECEKCIGILFTILRIWFGCLGVCEKYFGERIRNWFWLSSVLDERNISMNVKSVWVYYLLGG